MKARSRLKRVGVVGTFDVANFGDLLFPLLLEHSLLRRLGPLEVRRYSHRPLRGSTWPYEVRSLDELIGSVEELDLLVVGGGHLVRFDSTVAPGYEAVDSGIPHPGGYWLSPTLAAAAAGTPVAWSALGVSLDTPVWAQSLLAWALNAADYVSVRDPESRTELSRFAPTEAVRLVPDTAFGIREYLASRSTPGSEDERARLVDGPYVLIQCSRGLAPVIDEIATAVPELQSAGLTVVEVPVSPVLGDRHGLLGELGRGVLRLDPMPDPIALAELIGGAQAVVAHSLHCSIVALAHGVPVFRAATPEGTKYHALADLPGVAIIGAGGGLASAIVGGQQGGPSTSVQERIAQLEVHWDRIAELVAEPPPEGARRRRLAARRAIALLPTTLSDLVTSFEHPAAEALDENQPAPEPAADEAPAHAAFDPEQLIAERDAAVETANEAERRAQQAERERRESDELRQKAERERQVLADREALTLSRLAQANERAVALTDRIGALELSLARDRGQAAADRRRAADELDRRKRELAEAGRTIRKLSGKAASYDRMRRRLVVRAGLAALRAGRRVARLTKVPGPVTEAKRPSARPSEAEQRSLADALLAEAPGSTRTSGPTVTIIILNRDGERHLRRLLPALAQTTYTSHEVIVVDNGSTDASTEVIETAGLSRVTVIGNRENRPFADANNQAVQSATGEYLLFLNNDVEPLGPGWLGRLVDTLEEREAAAVGARLVYPRRQDGGNTGDHAFPDLSLQHRGIAFVAADGVPTGRNLGTGEDPRAPEAARIADVSGATAACLLVRRPAFEAVGGFTAGYVYGTEDVDLCLKLQAAGERVVYDGGAVLWHHEYGTQNAHGREWKKRNRVQNRQLFVDRWSPQIFREVFRDRVRGRRRWSEDPVHVGITLTKDDPEAGWGDYYTAHELGDALGGLGWRVSYLERGGDRWYDVDRSVDVVVSLLDAYDLRRIPRGIVTIAWVRNWTDRWLGHPWFDEYDIVLASSEKSREIIASRSTRTPALMPLATNPERFKPGEPSEELRADLLFVGNSWGVGRGIETVLPQVAEGLTVSVFGRGWETTELAPFHRGSLGFERLPAAYRSAQIVLDDTAGPTLPYGALNARVFDALASGALVVSDNEVGVRELFGDAFPVARTSEELADRITWARDNPGAVRELVAGLRDRVLKEHTYAHRAAEIRDHLLKWVEATRYAILVGIPTWDQAAAWGDYHFARAVQRRLERRGHPTRIHLLDEWGRSPSARADVAIHLHGLSDHRVRPSQLNVLWIISHPDRITPTLCDKYDLVLVASDSFAEDLRHRVEVPVLPLHQATDPDRFFPDPGGPPHELLFVANTRNARRPIIEDITPTTHDLAVYGKGWTSDLIDPVHVRGEHIPNEELHRYYSSAHIVLNDHWPDMRAHGFLSNRLYDALACGAFIVSDAAVGMEEEFDGAIATYADRDDLRSLIDRYLHDPEARRAMAERGREIVLQRHTFERRVDQLLQHVEALGVASPRRIEAWPTIAAWLDRRRRRTGRAVESPPRGGALELNGISGAPKR